MQSQHTLLMIEKQHEKRTARSVRVSVGLAGVSLKMSLVLGLIAASTTAGSRKSTNEKLMPRSLNMTRAALFVPPAERNNSC
jgi:hypothetical protein